MLWRKRQKDIIDWIDNGKDALLVTGARQIGKTYLIEETLKETNADYVTFNLINQPEIVKIFDSINSFNIDVFLERLTIATAHNLIKGKTIIFFDEIQECKDIVTKIKFLVQEGSYRYVLSGSLLGVELTGLKSAPVGYLRSIEMYPMDFCEFTKALNIKDSTLKILEDAFNDEHEVDEFIHNRMIEAFNTYLLVGGMPEAVVSYVENGDYNKILGIHNKIIEQYKVDFTKYEIEKRLTLIKTYELIPSELSDKNKRYIISDINEDAKFDRYENSFNWLIDAGVAIPTYNVSEPRLPIELNKKSNLFKLFLSDIGLLTSLYGKTTQLAVMNNDKSLNAGAIYENVVAQELNSHGYKCYYFNSHKQGEVDFLIEYRDKILPIEVKSGKDYLKHNALNNILDNRDYGIEKAFVLSNANVLKKDKIIYYPVYMLMFIDKNNEENPPLKILDLSTL